LPPDIFPLCFSRRHRLGPFLYTGPVCLPESFRTTFNLHWSGLPLSVSSLKPRFSRFDLLVRFPKAEDLSVHAALQDLSVFPKAEDLSVRAARQDLSVFPKAEDLSDFQVWDIGQVPVSNFDWIPFTPLWSPSLFLHPMYLIPSLPPAHLR
jgi:hypothetical protein